MTDQVKDLLAYLPPYQDQWEMIHPDQTVPDIIGEVLEAHKLFAPYYDRIALFFDSGDTETICKDLFYFLKNNIKYKEEKKEDQTSALPTGILIRGQGDCKHYSGWIAGILDALCRQGKKINWCYRFASYKILDRTPHHVFIVVNPGKNELWIDPTPGANKLFPFWQIDKKVKMALRRNIAGFSDVDYIEYENVNTIGRPYWQLMPMLGARSQPNPQTPGPNNKYFTGPFLGLQFYSEDGLSNEGTNWQVTADALNQMIQAGPSPGHTVPADFVKWLYETNSKGYNFYYPNGGVQPGYVPNLPANYPKLVITEDGRLTFDRDQKIDDYKNDEIHALTAWANSLIFDLDETPNLQKPAALKEFSQGKKGNVNVRDMFTLSKKKSLFGKVAAAIGDTVKFLKNGVFKIVGSIPRNAFLGLVGINAFNFAGNMWNNIQAGKWPEMAKKWQNLGGNPDKLKNTIEDGKSKKAILGEVDHSGRIGEPLTVSAALAAAAPIVAALLAFLDKDGKAGEVLQVAKASLQKLYPDLDLTSFGFIDTKTGKPIEFTVDDIDNENFGGGNDDMPGAPKKIFNDPLIMAATGGAATYLLVNGKGKKKNFILPLIAAGGIYFLMSNRNGIVNNLLNLTDDQKIKALNNYIDSGGDTPAAKASFKQIIASMSQPELTAVYDYIFNYVLKGTRPPVGSELHTVIIAIANKYNIFQ